MLWPVTTMPLRPRHPCKLLRGLEQKLEAPRDEPPQGATSHSARCDWLNSGHNSLSGMVCDAKREVLRGCRERMGPMCNDKEQHARVWQSVSDAFQSIHWDRFHTRYGLRDSAFGTRRA